MEEKIEKIFREIMELDDDVELKDDMCSDNVEEWDSLASMSLVVKLEKEFGVKYEFNDILQMDSLGAIKNVTLGKVQ
jgi:Acyl carrier protein